MMGVSVYRSMAEYLPINHIKGDNFKDIPSPRMENNTVARDMIISRAMQDLSAGNIPSELFREALHEDMAFLYSNENTGNFTHGHPIDVFYKFYKTQDEVWEMWNEDELNLMFNKNIIIKQGIHKIGKCYVYSMCSWNKTCKCCN